MTNKNLRVLKTKRKLLDALIELKQAEHKKITISKLIQHAHITRGTFYLHYHDCDDFLHAINIQIVDTLFEACMIEDDDQQRYFSFEEALIHIQNDHLVYQTLLADQRDDCLYQCLEDRFKQEIVKHLRANDSVGLEHLLVNIKATLMAGAIMNVIHEWLSAGRIYNGAYLAKVIENGLDQLVAQVGDDSWQTFYKGKTLTN